MYPRLLEEIRTFLVQNPIIISTEHSEGRRNSQSDEDNIIALLQKEFGNKHIIPAPTRAWYDVLVIEDTKIYPVNIKTTSIFSKSEKTRPDNAGNKPMVLYALTTIPTIFDGKRLTFTGISKLNMGEDKWVPLLLNNKGDLDCDYYFLVLDKDNTSNVILVGLRDCILSNNYRNASYNLPFQIDWRQNK